MIVVILIHKIKKGGININTIIDELRNINYQFLSNNKNGFKINNKNYIYKNGVIPILFSAPHAVKQSRELQIKPSDYLTGPLAIFLANRLNCSYFVRVFNDSDDPNYPLGITLSNIENDYLLSLIKFLEKYKQFLVIDLHGCKNSKNADCSLWHNRYNTCDYNIIKIFEENFKIFNLSSDNGQEYLGGQVTRQCANFTNAFQLEIKRKIRSLELKNFYLLKSFIDSMEKSIYEIYFFKKNKESRESHYEYSK